jgi:hypothetical protein
MVSAGCGEDSSPPTTLPPLTDAPATGTTAEPTPGTITPPADGATTTPGQFDELTRADAEAFVEEFWRSVNRGLRAGSAEGIEQYYEPSCQTCETIRNNVQELDDKGQRAEGAEQAIVETRFDDNNGPVAVVTSVVQSQPGRLLTDDGKLVREIKGGPPADYVFNIVQQRDRSWLIQDLLALGPRAS